MLDFPDLEEPRPFTDAEQQAIDDLKELFKKNSDINFQTDDYFLTKFLRYRDWNPKAAYDSVVLYYKLKVMKWSMHQKRYICRIADCILCASNLQFEFTKLNFEK